MLCFGLVCVKTQHVNILQLYKFLELKNITFLKKDNGGNESNYIGKQMKFKIFDFGQFDFVSMNTWKGQQRYFPQTTSIKYGDHKCMKENMLVDSSDD